MTKLALPLTSLLVQRLDVWDKIDRAYDAGNIGSAVTMTKYVQKVLDPQIKEAYGL